VSRSGSSSIETARPDGCSSIRSTATEGRYVSTIGGNPVKIGLSEAPTGPGGKAASKFRLWMTGKKPRSIHLRIVAISAPNACGLVRATDLCPAESSAKCVSFLLSCVILEPYDKSLSERVGQLLERL